MDDEVHGKVKPVKELAEMFSESQMKLQYPFARWFFNNNFRLWVKQEPCVNAISCFSYIVHNGSANKQPRH